MFGSIDKSKGLLLCTHDLDQSLRNTVQQMRQEVEGLDANRLLNTAPEDLKSYLVAKYRVEPIRLLRDDWYADHHDVPVDVRYDPMRWIDDKSRPVMVPGERVEIRVPFEGEAELFYARPNTMSSSPPRGVVEKNDLLLRYDSPSDAPRDVRPLVDRTLAEVEQYLGRHTDLVGRRGAHRLAGQGGADRRQLQHADHAAGEGGGHGRAADTSPAATRTASRRRRSVCSNRPTWCNRPRARPSR